MGSYVAACATDAADGEGELALGTEDADSVGVRTQALDPARSIGHWSFDDCGQDSNELRDGSPSANHATRTAMTGCAAGRAGSAVVFNSWMDLVRVPSAPSLALRNGVTVDAWVNARSTQAGVIVNKQTFGRTVFELSVSGGQAVFAVAVQTNTVRRVSVSAPIAASQWTHLTGTYDGQNVRLFVNGAEAADQAAAGVIADTQGQLRIGSSMWLQAFSGAIDEVAIASSAIAPDPVDPGPACVRRPPTLAVSPASSGPVEPRTTVDYQVSLTNQDQGPCPPSVHRLVIGALEAGLTAQASDAEVPVSPGQTLQLPLSVTGEQGLAPGPHRVPFQVVDVGAGTALSGSVEYVIRQAPTPCVAVQPEKELLIRDLSVVEDPVRTTGNGVWTFAHLMEQAAPSAERASELAESLFNTWLSTSNVNGFLVPDTGTPDRAAALRTLVLQPWPRVNGALDLTRAPLRLLSIVNRVDLRNLAEGHAGEGRFVFGVLDAGGAPTQFTLIFEFRLPASSVDGVLEWANAWHALGSLPFPSEAYNAALAALTERFVARGAGPGRVNGSALGQVRTNEVALGFPWDLRELQLSPATGLFALTTVKGTPDHTTFFNNSPVLARFINQNEAAILEEQHEVPLTFEGAPFLGGASRAPPAPWRADGINNPEARQRFSLNTCDGCHSAETNTFFTHVFPRFAGLRAELSGFMTGITLADPVSGVPRSFNDLARRDEDLTAIVCGGTAQVTTAELPLPPVVRSTMTPPPPSRMRPSRLSFLARGLGRVH